MRNECEQRPTEWLRIRPRFQTWMIRRMVSFTKRRHTLGEKGWQENIRSSVLNILNLRCCDIFRWRFSCGYLDLLHRKEEDKD